MTLTTSPIQILWLYLSFLAAGFVGGMVYELPRSFRFTERAFLQKHKVVDFVLAFLSDLLFFVLNGCVFSVLFYVFDFGRVRFFCFPLWIFGFWIYRMSLGRILSGMDRFLISAMLEALKWIAGVILIPFKIVFVRMIRKADAGRAKRKKKKQERLLSRAILWARSGYRS